MEHQEKEGPRVEVFGKQVSGCDHDHSHDHSHDHGDHGQTCCRGGHDGAVCEGKHCHGCRHGRGSNPVGGVVFVFAGIVLLLNALGVISWGFWDAVVNFWPVILILLGVQMILGRGLVSRVIVLVVTIAALLFITSSAVARSGRVDSHQGVPITGQQLQR